MARFRFILFVAWRCLIKRPRTTALLLFGMAAGVFVLVVMTSMMLGFQTQALDTLLATTPSILVDGRPREAPTEGRLFSGEGDTYYLQGRLKPAEPEKGIRGYGLIVDRMEQVEGVTAVAPICQGRVVVRFGTRERGSTLIGVHAPEYDRVVEFRSKVIGDADDMTRRRDGCILGFLLAEELGAAVGDRLLLVGADGKESSVRLVALFRSGLTLVDRTFSFCNLGVAQSLLDYPGAVTGMALKVDEFDRAPQIAKQVEWTTGLRSRSWQELNSNIFEVIRQQNFTTFGAVGMTLIVAGFGIANGLITAVLEKRRDIGILRAMGVTQQGVALVFVLQGALLGIAGALLGLALAAWAIDVMSHTKLPGRGGLSTASTFLMLRAWWIFAGAAGFAVIISLIASLFPARRAAQYEPVEIIRHARA